MKQREIWVVNLDPTIGAEIKKRRPCVIVNDDTVGVLPLKIIAPITDYKDKWRIRHFNGYPQHLVFTHP